jgi:hypothetical protein
VFQRSDFIAHGDDGFADIHLATVHVSGDAARRVPLAIRQIEIRADARVLIDVEADVVFERVLNHAGCVDERLVMDRRLTADTGVAVQVHIGRGIRIEIGSGRERRRSGQLILRRVVLDRQIAQREDDVARLDVDVTVEQRDTIDREDLRPGGERRVDGEEPRRPWRPSVSIELY